MALGESMRLGRWARRASLVSSFGVLGVLAARAAVGCGGDPFTAGPADAGPPTSDVTQPPSDAPSDSTDAPAGTWCALHAANVTFCEDFEGVANIADLTARWSGFVGGNGTLSLLSPGLLSLHALGATAGNNDQASLVHAPFPGRPATSIRVEYDLRVDAEKVLAFDAAGLTSIILGNDPTTAPAVYLYIGNAGGLVLGWADATDAGRGYHFQALNVTPTLGMWDGRWGITIAMSDGTMTVTHAQTVVATSNQKLAMGDLQIAAVTVQAGLSHNTGNTGTVTVAIDDLVVDIK
jgi:hypothetical protein